MTSAILCSLVPASAAAGGSPTVYDNQNLYPMGSRAAGMGGAYTAQACDEVALHYNPASLACAEESHLELVANAYMIQHLSVPGALGPGQDLTATTYHSIPSAVGAVYIVADGDPDTRAGRQAFGFLVSVPASISLKSEPTSATTRNFLATQVRDDVLAGDVGYAIGVLPRLSLGISLGGGVRTATQSTSLLLTRPLAQGVEFVSLGDDLEVLALGLRGKIGARYTPTSSLALGLSVVTPSLDVYGSFKQSTNVAVGAIDPDTGAPVLEATPVRLVGRSGASFSMKLALGVSYTYTRWTFAADVSLALPRDVAVAYDVAPIRIEGVADPTTNPVTLRRTWQPNVAVGAEARVSRGIAVAFGAFTDLSSVPASTEAEDRVHMFGGTAALSFVSAQTRGTFGVSFSCGSGDSVVQSGRFDLDALSDPSTTVARISRYNVVGFIGSSYSFLPDDVAARAMAEKRQKREPSPR